MSPLGYDLFGRRPAREDRGSATVRRLTRAAAVTILFVGGFLLMRSIHAFPEAGNNLPTGPMRTVSSAIGKRATVSLPDGSEVILGPGSTLSYPSAEFQRRREVLLDGEAYFRIVPQPQQPFVVRLGDFVAKNFAANRASRRPFVVHAGDSAWNRPFSEFVVRAYPEDPHPQVAVRSGAVTLVDRAVAEGWTSWLADDTVVTEPADTATWFSWTSGRITFTNAFRDALPRLRRWYGLDLRVEGALGDAVLAAALPDSLEDGVLQAIAVATSAEIERHGRVVTFRRVVNRPPAYQTK